MFLEIEEQVREKKSVETFKKWKEMVSIPFPISDFGQEVK